MSPPSPPAPVDPARAHGVVVGVGGIGCPAAWGLADAGIGRLTLLDPDVVAASNLPRQILYAMADVGKPKALLAAQWLRETYPAIVLEARAERLDDTNADAVLADADFLVDATDGARAKDWLNALAVARGLPLVHAAGLRSEGRILDVPAGGRPCLACLFGRLEDELGSCADLGVWGGVVGAVGFLAAATALRRLQHPDSSSSGYAVLDLEGGRAVTLDAEAAAGCPVCAKGARRDADAPYPRERACAADPAEAPASPEEALLDLVDESCPMNLLRARQALDALAPGAALAIRLGAEGRESVPEGLRALGHGIDVLGEDGSGLLLRVVRGMSERSDAPSGSLERDVLLRYARQVVLPEVGEAGQRRLLASEAVVVGRGAVSETAAVYLRAAGVGSVGFEETAGRAVAPGAWGRRGDASHRHGFSVACSGESGRIVPGAAVAAGTPLQGPAARALGALLADTVCRAIVHDGQEAPRVVVRASGTIGSA